MNRILLTLIVATFAATPVVAQSADVERTVLGAAISYQTGVAMPYIDQWFVSNATEPLAQPTNDARFAEYAEDYRTRNADRADLADLPLPSNAMFAASGEWPVARSSNEARRALRLARPAFRGEDDAVVRYDLLRSPEAVPAPPLSGTIYLHRSSGSWKVVGGHFVTTR